MNGGDLSPSVAVRVLFGSELRPAPRWLLTCLIYRCDRQTWATTRYQASIAWLAKASGFSERVVVRHLRTLERTGYVRRWPQVNRQGTMIANLYELDRSKFRGPRAIPDAAREHLERRRVELEPTAARASREVLAALAKR